MLALAGTAAWLLDLGTMHPSREANTLVLALGPDAPLVKVAVLVFALTVAWCVRTTYGRHVLMALVLVGCVGALSNAWALG